MALRFYLLISAFLLLAQNAFAEQAISITGKPGLVMSSQPLKQKIIEPAWFKLSLLDMQGDIDDAKEANKSGIIVYFGQKRCPYCKKFLDDNFSNKELTRYTRKNFDVISINVRGTRQVTGFKGKTFSERKFAHWNKANLTPTIIFFGTDGKPILKLVGYQSPKKFRSAMNFVVEKRYRKKKFVKSNRDSISTYSISDKTSQQ